MHELLADDTKVISSDSNAQVECLFCDMSQNPQVTPNSYHMQLHLLSVIKVLSTQHKLILQPKLSGRKKIDTTATHQQNPQM